MGVTVEGVEDIWFGSLGKGMEYCAADSNSPLAFIVPPNPHISSLTRMIHEQLGKRIVEDSLTKKAQRRRIPSGN